MARAYSDDPRGQVLAAVAGPHCRVRFDCQSPFRERGLGCQVTWGVDRDPRPVSSNGP